jgi:hypothetical protein
MVLLSGSGTGGGIYAKLANGVAQYNCAQVSPTTIHRPYDLLHIINKCIITNALTGKWTQAMCLIVGISDTCPPSDSVVESRKTPGFRIDVLRQLAKDIDPSSMSG